MTKLKLALCAPKEQIVNKDISPNDWTLMLQDRAIVDGPTTRDPSIQQLLPYVMLVTRERTPNGTINKVFSYKRPDKASGNEGEPDLIGKNSIGFGGHVDTYPGKGIDITTHLALEAFRELREEIGFVANISKLISLINSSLSSRTFIMVEDEVVDTVHCGIPIVYVVDETEKLNIQSQYGEISEVKEIDLTETLTNSDEFLKYESWSRWLIIQLADAKFEYPTTKDQILDLSQVDFYRNLMPSVFAGRYPYALDIVNNEVSFIAAKVATPLQPATLLNGDIVDAVYKNLCNSDIFKFRVLAGAAGWGKIDIYGDLIVLAATYREISLPEYRAQIVKETMVQLQTSIQAATPQQQ